MCLSHFTRRSFIADLVSAKAIIYVTLEHSFFFAPKTVPSLNAAGRVQVPTNVFIMSFKYTMLYFRSYFLLLFSLFSRGQGRFFFVQFLSARRDSHLNFQNITAVVLTWNAPAVRARAARTLNFEYIYGGGNVPCWSLPIVVHWIEVKRKRSFVKYDDEDLVSVWWFPLKP